jgi:hypothetical protein
MYSSPLPVLLTKVDRTSLVQRGYEAYDPDVGYDAVSQISELIRCGSTSPTTMSSCAGTTGVFSTDADQSADDEGTD